ncbi:MAG: LPS-assembly protein LptD [Campylobacterota bacterium]
MLKKIVLPLTILSSLALSNEVSSQEKFQFLAKDVKTDGDIVTAIGDVVVFSKTYYISANKIIYNKKNNSFELFDDVFVLKNNNLQTQSNYAFLDLDNENYDQAPVLIMDKTTNLWINSQKSQKRADDVDLDSSILSSCDCIDPAWSIKVSSANYDTEDKWLNTYNTRLYIGDIPVFYTPYLGFSTDKSRRTGLLTPTVGYSKNQGFYYAQPIYYAPSKSYDLEFVPQIRTDRGLGLYTYYRLADSPYSRLDIKTGFFRENSNYQKEFELKNEKHYGFNIDYSRTKLFSNSNTQDGLYASINWLNDIEYKTIENEEDNLSTEKKVESKINYFYNTSEYYGGAYLRYYIDTELDSNDETLQELPNLQLHSYTKELSFLDNLTYNANIGYSNYERKEGVNANIYTLSVPVSYSKYFFNDYLYANVSNNIVINQYEYSNANTSLDDGTLIQNETSFLVGTDLIKPYDNFLHTLNLSAKYSKPENISEKGDLYNITVDKDSNKEKLLSPFPTNVNQERMELSLNQSFFKGESLKEIINHRLTQSIIYDNGKAKFQNLENFLKYSYDYGSVSTKNIYNMQDDKFIENSASFSYSYNDLTFSMGYYKSKESENSGLENLESYRLSTTYDITNTNSITYYENYNIQDSIRNKQGVGFGIDERCWGLNLKYEKEVIPSTSINQRGIKQNILYIQLQLKPLGGVKQKYEFEDN